jgi:hypothetical protein
MVLSGSRIRIIWDNHGAARNQNQKIWIIMAQPGPRIRKFGIIMAQTGLEIRKMALLYNQKNLG